jgi:hypothetical protein
MSFCLEVQLRGKLDFETNNIRFAAPSEAREYGNSLEQRWRELEAWRVGESTEPVNYHHQKGAEFPLFFGRRVQGKDSFPPSKTVPYDGQIHRVSHDD